MLDTGSTEDDEQLNGSHEAVRKMLGTKRPIPPQALVKPQNNKGARFHPGGIAIAEEIFIFRLKDIAIQLVCEQ